MQTKEQRHITQKGIDLIKRLEGCKYTMYWDVANYPTIGVGHRIMPNEMNKYRGISLTEEEVDELLKKDVNKFERSVLKWITVPLADCMFDALVSWTFNLGGAALQRSTMRQCINRWEYYPAADEMLKWVYAGGRKRRGLIRRRKIERKVFLYSTY